MTYAKATHLGIVADEIIVGCWADKYGGQWVAYVPDRERTRRVVKQGGIFAVAQWVEGLRRYQQ